MKYTCSIPTHFNGSVEKIDQMLEGTTHNVNPFLVTEYRWTRGGLQLFVKPWTQKPYIYCVVVKPQMTLPRSDYQSMFQSGRQLYVKFQQTINGFNAELTLPEKRVVNNEEEW